MRRRQFIAGVATATTVGLAGCGGGGGGPAGVVNQFVSALNNGNIEKANSLYHPDSSAAQIPSSMGEQMSEFTFSVQNTEVVEESDGQATVEADIKVEMMGESQTSTSTFELRTYEGEWRIWSGGGVQ